MSGAEFERRDRSNGDELIPRVSRETIDIVNMEFLNAEHGSGDLVETYLERISRVNPEVAGYIAGLAQQIPEELYSSWVVHEGVLVYRVLELEFAQRGKEMPIVQREIADSLKMDPDQKERYFSELASSLVTENYELRQELAFSQFLLTWLPSKEVPTNQVARLARESALGVYALIQAQAKADRLSGL